MASNSVSGGNGPYTLTVYADLVEQSIEGNWSKIRHRGYLTTGTFHFISSVEGRGWANGSLIWSKSDNMTTATGSTYLLFDYTSTKYHNADGTASAAVTRATFQTDNQSQTWRVPPLDVSVSLALATIPRATTPDISGGVFTTGASTTINLPRAASGFTHDVSYEIGTKSGSIATGAGVTTAWTPPNDLATEFTNAASSPVNIIVVTKNGATTIGSKTVSFTLNAASSIVPTISAVSWEDTNSTVASAIGAYLQDISRIKGSVVAAGFYGSTIVSKVLLVGTAQTEFAEHAEFVPPAAGTLTASGKATDSRSRSATLPANITVLPYAKPAVSGFQVRRAASGGALQDDGTYLRIDLNAAVQSIIVGAAEKNALAVAVKTRESGSPTWVDRDGLAVTGLTFNSYALISGGDIFHANKSYDVRIEVSDNAGSMSPHETTVSTASVALHLDGSNVGVGKMREDGALDVGGDTYVRGDVFAEGLVTAEGGDFSEDVAVVGSISAYDSTVVQSHAGEFWSGGLLVAGAALRGNTAKMNLLKTGGYAYDGMRFFNTDDSREYVFNGTIWVDPRTLPVQGRIPSSVQVGAGTASVAGDGSVSFINASAVSLNGVFDGLGQDMYDIFIELSSSAGSYTGIYTRMRSAGVDNATALYNYVGNYTAHNTGPTRYSVFGASMAGYLNPGLGNASPVVNARLFMTNPGTPIATTFILQTTVAASDRYLCHEYGELNSAVVCDGFSIRPTAGLLSGTIKVVKLS